MAGTFGSFNIAATALRHQRIAMDVAGGNIANVSVEGFVRRRVEGATLGAPTQPAMWSKYDGAGEGVRTTAVNRMTDALLEDRVRRETGTQSYLTTRAASLARFEEGVGEPGDKGVSAMLNQFGKAWSDVSNQPDSIAARNQVLTSAASLADALRLQAQNVDVESADQRMVLLTTVSEANVLAHDLAETNRAIISGGLDGSDINSLLDTRDLLATKLANLTGARMTETTSGAAEVTLNGVTLVSGSSASKIAVTGGVNPDGTSDGNPVTFAVVDKDGNSTAVTGQAGGRIGGVSDLLDNVYPAYTRDLGAIATQLATAMNTQHQAGFDQNGAAGQALFTFDPANPAASIKVAITDPALLAVSGVGGPANTDNGNALLMRDTKDISASYQRLVNGLGTTVASAHRLAENQKVVTTQVNNAREQQTGINFDDEMVNLMQAQRSYEAASRVMTVIDSVLDTLINRTGLVR